jgi:energy-coupling factor transporter ATP-binding protein EcfA2
VGKVADERGSVWRRWDPHIHTPGTILSNQFGSATWDEYLTKLETCDPPIAALGITDYCSLDRYQEVVSHIAEGRLPDVGLIFANVELRLPIETQRGHPVNIHLLFSPDDPNHVEEARRFLRGLKFDYQGETYGCERSELIRLGRKHDSSLTDENVALRTGTNQFKVTPAALTQAIKSSVWAQENVLVAVAGGSNDGTSGVRSQDASMEATRVEIERMASIVFSGQPAQRQFWLGEGAASRGELDSKWNGRKACLHGSDAHKLEKVGEPDERRYTWVKGDPTFEALRQACLEPATRVVVGDTPPGGALDGRTITRITVTDADWLETQSLPLNRGLVAIIGARGSGKTALADLLAYGSYSATSDRTSNQSFLRRARHHLDGTRVALEWGDGASTGATLGDAIGGSDQTPMVQYLSQQFVEQLCSSEGITDELLREIERVIFESHAYEDRMGASSFQEMLGVKAGPGRLKRDRASQDIAEIAAKIDAERDSRADLPALKKQIDELERSIASEKTVRDTLLRRGGDDHAERLNNINAALTRAQAQADVFNRQDREIKSLRREIDHLTSRTLPKLLNELKTGHSSAGITDDEWSAFRLIFEGNPAAVIEGHQAELTAQLAEVVGPIIQKPDGPVDQIPAFFAANAELSEVSLNSLKAESWRLSQLIGLDAARSRQLDELNVKITRGEGSLESLRLRIVHAEGASARIDALAADRQVAYASLFDGFAEEQAQLADLYLPLAEILGEQAGALAKLSFTVRRIVDANAWAARGENLLDLRKSGPFRGHGELLKVAQNELMPAWTTGSSEEVAAAMTTFREAHDKDILAHAKAERTDAVAYRAWGVEVASWLNGTDHISVQYGVQYDGIDIEQLSPGTRGIVLLLLYLSLDQIDDRPLVIDQPEENLDPKSIFDELVGRFRETRLRRQIVIVTHNANLVVNSDADQVIVANAGAHSPGELPKITYLSGGLENSEIRSQVCEILEGGKQAFEERARRLRFKLTS